MFEIQFDATFFEKSCIKILSERKKYILLYRQKQNNAALVAELVDAYV